MTFQGYNLKRTPSDSNLDSEWIPNIFVDLVLLDIRKLSEELPDTSREFRDLLNPIAGICTYDLLHKARAHTYGENYHLAPSCYEESNNWQYDMLMSLDRSGHVPYDAPQTIEFEGHIRHFVQHVLQKMRRDLPNNVKLKPLGSFACNTKVGDIDEFDYLLELDISEPTVTKYDSGNRIRLNSLLCDDFKKAVSFFML